MSEMTTYTPAVQTIKTAILQGQYEAAKGVNRVQLAVYYSIGRYVSQNTRVGKWGTGALKAISEQLQKEMPGLRGYSAENLKKMRLFYEAWMMLDAKSSVVTDENSVFANTEIVESKSFVMTNDFSEANSFDMSNELQIVENKIDIYNAFCLPNLVDFPVEDFFKVPFSHHMSIILAVEDYKERCYYIHRQAEERMPVRRLEQLMKEDVFHHQGLMPNNFASTISDAALARKAVMAFKDSYLLNFINVEEIGERDKEDIDERVVEQSIVHNIKKFIMTFGRDFAFVGNQYHLEVYTEEFFPDLLFFNRELNALVVIELKMGKFKPAYLGQLTTYLRILDDKVRKPHENRSIGIVLCKTADKDFVEYVIQDYDKPMGVATYTSAADLPEPFRNALPDVEEMRKLLTVEE